MVLEMFIRKKHVLILLLALGLALPIAAWVMTAPPAVPSYSEVVRRYRTSEGILLDRRHRVLHQLRVADKGREARLDASRRTFLPR